jgi:hypothetical protein
MAKEIISESRLKEIISEEAARFKKKLTLEAEKKKLLSKLNEMYAEEGMTEEDTLDEVDLNKAAHKDAIDFVENHPQKDAIKMTYENGKKDKASLLKFNKFVIGYAMNTLKKNNAGASDFLKDVVRVLEGRIDAPVHTNTPSTFGE